MSDALLVLIPVYDDWHAVGQLIAHLDRALSYAGRRASVLLVDDGSSEAIGTQLAAFASSGRPGISGISVLRLRRNLGTQRAIAVGLSFVAANLTPDAVVVMDADGQDLPDDVPRLLEEFERKGGQAVVFAERTRRSESISFVVLYGAYRALHRVLTGERVRVGNFSVVPGRFISTLVVMSDLWNHYAAAVFKSRLPYATLSTVRGRRYSGSSHMNYVALVIHGLSAMSVFGDRIGVRVLTAMSIATLAACVGGAAAMAATQRVAGGLPAWVPFALIVGGAMLLQVVLGALAFALMILGSRDNATFLPVRDYAHFVESLQRLDVPDQHVVSVSR
jgi:hypothetical protein